MNTTGAAERGEASAEDMTPRVATEQMAGRRWERSVDTAVVVILAVASLLAAWAGYQAGLWSGKKTAFIVAAEDKQIDATRANTVGYQIMQIDTALFMNWLNAFKTDNSALADFYAARFTPQLARAFVAWMATDPLQNPEAPADPFRMAEYQVPQLQAAAILDEEAGQAFADAEHAGAIGDAYVLAAMLLAVVLFFAGVSTKIGWQPAQLALLGAALLLLLLCLQKLSALPDASGWALTPLLG